MASGKYELVFWGSGSVRAYKFPRYKRYHSSVEKAEAVASEVRARLDEKGIPSAAHPAIVYGPGLGSDGRRI